MIEGLKGGDIKVATSTIEPEWNFMECEQAFRGAYRSCRVNGRPRMDYSTFFGCIREGLIDLIKQELIDLNSARVQTTTTWIRFLKDDNRVELVFNSRMTDVEIIKWGFWCRQRHFPAPLAHSSIIRFLSY